MSDTHSLKGVVVPVITPLGDDETVDETAFRAQIDRLIDAGVGGLFVGGSAGEGPLHTETEWRRMIEIAGVAVDGRVPLLGGVADTSTRRVVDKIERIAATGAYQFFVPTPTFYLANSCAAEHLRLHETCWQHRGGMEMIAYNIPSCVGSALAPDTVVTMAANGWIRYCKESSGDRDTLLHYLNDGGPVGLQTLVGDEPLIVAGLIAGGVGFVPVLGNVVPELCVGIFDAVSRGDLADAVERHARLMRIRDVLLLAGDCWLSGIKYAVSTMGIGNGRISSPLQPTGDQQKEAIAAVLAEA